MSKFLFNKFNIYIILFNILSSLYINIYAYDLTIIGQVKFAESLPRLSIGIIDCLKDYLKINFIPTSGFFDLQEVPVEIKKIINNPDKTPGKVALLSDMLWSIYQNSLDFMPASTIKIAYSMLESNEIPKEWVNILNNKFDAAVVPDDYYLEVYKNCGVKIPIFVIPCGIYCTEFFNKNKKIKKNNIFNFGISAAFTASKNYELLIESFAKTFGNNRNIGLKIHGRAGCNYILIKDLIKKFNLKNVSIILKELNRYEYFKFISSLDCYILVSKGEGFSITPREALACGIPCILSDNTAHKTICQTGYVRAVKSDIPEYAFYRGFGRVVGQNFNCSLEDVSQALKDVYKNHNTYLNKARQARAWVEQYLYKNLKNKYLNLIKPQKIILSDKNEITDNALITNSKDLYDKYTRNN